MSLLHVQFLFLIQVLIPTDFGDVFALMFQAAARIRNGLFEFAGRAFFGSRRCTLFCRGKGGERGVGRGGGLGGRHGRDQKRGKVEWVNGGRHGMLLQEHIDL